MHPRRQRVHVASEEIQPWGVVPALDILFGTDVIKVSAIHDGFSNPLGAPLLNRRRIVLQLVPVVYPYHDFDLSSSAHLLMPA